MSLVSSLAFTPSSVFIDVVAPADGDVVVTQQAAPGWSVTVDGMAANPHEISVFRAVHVTRGRHAIKWIYRPRSLIFGAILTLAALVRLLFSTMFVKRGELIGNGITLEQAVEAFEGKYIVAAMSASRGNVTQASKALGVHRNTLHNKLRSQTMLNGFADSIRPMRRRLSANRVTAPKSNGKSTRSR